MPFKENLISLRATRFGRRSRLFDIALLQSAAASKFSQAVGFQVTLALIVLQRNRFPIHHRKYLQHRCL